MRFRRLHWKLRLAGQTETAKLAIETEERGKSFCIAGQDEKIETKIVGSYQK